MDGASLALVIPTRDQTSVRGAVEPKGLTSAARGIRPARARPPGRAQQAEPDPAGKRDDYPTRSRPRCGQHPIRHGRRWGTTTAL